MDVEASKKLREQPNVLQVLPDCAFDVKDKDKLGVLIVRSRHDSTHDLTHDSTHDLIHDSTVMIDYIDDLSYYKNLDDEETDDDEESEDEDEDEESKDEQSE
ncbi:hypothetical protein FRX31_005080 [Thalictrum thalictroides]|uniref:Uncharacterized protein n=1 Tax=Thalictrum thalictroides TaxID=46969 RepID=A0A7J6X7G0_THATH|nr:hypothetical protein FRX31_005080 [Thalictrum thalictroides]